MISPLICRIYRVLKRQENRRRLFTYAKVSGTRHRNIWYLTKTNLRAIICRLFMFAGVDSFWGFISTVALVIRRHISSILRISACLINTSHFGCALCRHSVTRAFRCPVINSNIFSLNKIARCNRLRTIFKISSCVPFCNSFIVFCSAPCRDVMFAFNNLIMRLGSRVDLNVKNLNCRRRT